MVLCHQFQWPLVAVKRKFNNHFLVFQFLFAVKGQLQISTKNCTFVVQKNSL